MRQSLLKSFDDIYVLDLHGNSKKKERSPDGSKDENIFDIQQGVAISIFVKRQGHHSNKQNAIVHHAHLWGPREIHEKVGKSYQRLVGGKYHWLAENNVATTEWTSLVPQAPFYLFIPQNITMQDEYNCGWRITDILLVNSTGIKTHRDHFVIDFDASLLRKRIEDFRDRTISNERIVDIYGLKDTRDWKLPIKRQALAASNNWEKAFTKILYRPFDIRPYYHHEDVVELPRQEIMQNMIKGDNIGLLVNRQIRLEDIQHFFITKSPADFHVLETAHASVSLFPLYIYPKLQSKKTLFEIDVPTNAPGGRRPNLDPSFIKDFSSKLNMRFVQDGKGNLQDTFGPEDILSYMYAIFYSPTYRERYAEFLKIDFPRLPLTSNIELFRELCELGQRLVELHLLEKFGKRTVKFPVQGNNIIEKVSYTDDPKEPEKGRVWINKEQYIEGMPPEVWEFHIGGYQVCEKWLKDRKGREFGINEFYHYQRIVAALDETMTLMSQIDEVIEEHGGWPIQ